MKQNKPKKYTYFFIALCFTCSIMFLKKSNFIENISESITLRYLSGEKVQNYVCDKAGSRLTDKYKKGYDEDSLEEKALTKSQQSIIDFARDSSYDNIEPYIKKLAIFIVILILDIIFIFCWIAYCCCCCCSCCLFGKPNPPSKTCANCNFIISFIGNFLVIIFSIIILVSINPYFKRINGLGCSAFNFLDHVRYGLYPHYPSHIDEWIGIRGLVDRLEYCNSQIKDIKKYKTTNCDITGETCSSYYSQFQNDCKETKALISSSFDDINFDNQIDELKSSYNTFNDTDEDIDDDVYDVLHDYVNGITKKVYTTIFTLTLIFGIFGLCFLLLYKLFKYCIFKVLYVIVWNISMLLMLLAVIAAIIFGIIGNVAKDGVAVVRYILSKENLNSHDPLVFSTSSDDNVDRIIDVCVNGDGNFFEVIQETGIIFENIKDLTEKDKKYGEIFSKISECPENLKQGYTELQRITYKTLNISHNITDVRCNFAKNDKNIILNEANSWGKRGIVLCTFSLLIAYLLGISVVTGILLVHRYNEESIEENPSKTKNNEISVNIGKDNKNVDNFNNYKNSDTNINDTGIDDKNITGLQMTNNMGMNNTNNFGLNNMNNII